MAIEIRNLVKRYGDVLAVDNIDLSVKDGEIHGLLGPNGAGKTTVINTIIGLTRVDSGDIRVFGRSMGGAAESEIKKDIGIVPQDIAVFDDLTALENVMFFGKLYGLRHGLLRERAEESLNFSGLWDKRKEYPKKFSGGMKRRLNIACAITHHPKLIIMDEPTVGIDPQSRNHILQSVRKLNEMGSTVLYTSHYMEEIEELCSYITIMDHGRIIAKGTDEELKAMISFEEKVEFELDAVNPTFMEGIRGIPGVKSVDLNDKRLTVVSVKGGKSLGRIIDIVSDTDAGILSVNVEKPSLEGVFLTLTGRTLRD